MLQIQRLARRVYARIMPYRRAIAVCAYLPTTAFGYAAAFLLGSQLVWLGVHTSTFLAPLPVLLLCRASSNWLFGLTGRAALGASSRADRRRRVAVIAVIAHGDALAAHVEPSEIVLILVPRDVAGMDAGQDRSGAGGDKRSSSAGPTRPLPALS